ncbi:MAG: hypothetical protein NTU62_10975 [Spirochaetes bacterium]|nr:hypothetical protein [Spirochaetota bacterium]
MVDIDVVPVGRDGEIDDVLFVLAHRAHPVVADVAAARGGVHHHLVAGPDVAAEDRVVRDRAADRPYVRVPAAEEALHALLQQALDLVDDLGAL